LAAPSLAPSDTITLTSQTAKGKDAAAEKLQEAKDALAQLKQLPKLWRDNAKQEAKAKVDRQRQLLKQMKALSGGDPKRAAHVLAQIAKELAAAVKQYVQAGGVSNEPSDSSLPSATENAYAQSDTNGAPPSEDVKADASAPTESEQPDSTDSTRSAAQATSAYQAARDGMQTSTTSQADQIAAAKDHEAFFDDVRALERKMREILDKVKLALKLQNAKPNRDVEDCEKALKEMDQQIASVSAVTGNSAMMGALTNLSA
jgi:hypothetical protein